jgi:hypothetical protein
MFPRLTQVKNVVLDSQNIISKPKCHALSNGELIYANILIFDRKLQLLDPKIENYYISCKNSEIICAPFERASFGSEMTFY